MKSESLNESIQNILRYVRYFVYKFLITNVHQDDSDELTV